MSWSISSKGKPAEVLAEIERYGSALTGQSKVEFQEAAPAIAGLVKQNFENREGRDQPSLTLSAWGSGSAQGEQQLERSCTVNLARSS